MTTLVFGSFPADMTEPEYFGHGRFFPSPDVELVSFSAAHLTGRDPLTGSTMTQFGSFDFSTDEAFLNSRVTGMVSHTSSGALLMEWQGVSLTVRQIMESSNDEVLNALILGGQDVISGGSGADVLRGYAGNDRLNGNGGNDVLRGDQGNDTVNGGVGIDTASYAGSAAGVRVNLGVAIAQNTVGAGTDTLISVENLTGSSLNDSLTGNTASNTLNGGLGNDTMVGGAGNDTYYRNATGDVVTEGLNAGSDTVRSSVTYTLPANVENLTLIGAGAINGAGNTLNNTLTGNAKNNILNGGAGNDNMIGGTGNDTYVRNATADVVTELANAGIDTVQSLVTYTLGANLENLTLTGAGNINGTGNSLANTLTGNSAANTLNGSGGHDAMSGGAGNDSLTGGTGNDSLTGGVGLDVFRFATTPSASSADRITDFNVVDDRIQLENAAFSTLAAAATLNTANFRANLTGTAVDANDYVLYDTDSGQLFYDADGSGAAAKVLIATLTGLPALTSADIWVS